MLNVIEVTYVSQTLYLESVWISSESSVDERLGVQTAVGLKNF